MCGLNAWDLSLLHCSLTTDYKYRKGREFVFKRATLVARCFMLVKNNVRKGHKVPENFDLNEFNEHLIVEIPLGARVYLHVDMR
jgi:hypothetical protein